MQFSIIIQGNSFGVLFNGLQTELPTILFTSTIEVVGCGWWGATKQLGKTHVKQ